MDDRNPSPPPESSEESKTSKGDKIGDTVFSQHWLFQTLLKVIEYVDKKDELHEDERHASGNDAAMEVDELHQELEDEMCTVWDMSANTDVAHFLVHFKARDLFLEIIDKTKSPRLLEIVSGIMGNMASFEDICDHFTEKTELVLAVLQLLGTTDTPTLIQIIRLIHVCVASPKSGILWTHALNNANISFNHLQFILQNSLNADLLKSTLKLLYYLLDKQEEEARPYEIDPFVKSLTVSANQFVCLNDLDSIVEYWHCLHLLCRKDQNVETIGNYEALIGKHLLFYIGQFLENEEPTPPKHHVTGLAAAFSTFNSLSSRENLDVSTIAILKDAKIMNYVKSLHSALQGKLSVQTEMDSPDPSNWELLFDVVTDTVSLSLQFTEKTEERER